MTTFRAVWPITDPGMNSADLIREAAHDLPSVAARHRVRITGTAHFQVRNGRNVQGSQGAAYVVVCNVPAEAVSRAEYGHVALVEDPKTLEGGESNSVVQSR
ncbi:hypothetical protein KKR91_01245 [Arthrobacter jiangjiafuii]|uniref:Uncharacterized protein n=1 Tax=Arthrobacter jiangjiafuii TaxID=2817475 RepID=A0A975R1C5_9MICC|nr:hypothetical protein [Arthrobacter jiangjiafuii]MBP3044867.1 hypothetical protein [Arthrobacter jiangjiafuii]QWC10309.1 hypothetical protein KKR91_01245 [Arthrobacter jiangjiafuii]